MKLNKMLTGSLILSAISFFLTFNIFINSNGINKLDEYLIYLFMFLTIAAPAFCIIYVLTKLFIKRGKLDKTIAFLIVTNLIIAIIELGLFGSFIILSALFSGIEG